MTRWQVTISPAWNKTPCCLGLSKKAVFGPPFFVFKLNFPATGRLLILGTIATQCFPTRQHPAAWRGALAIACYRLLLFRIGKRGRDDCHVSGLYAFFKNPVATAPGSDKES